MPLVLATERFDLRTLEPSDAVPLQRFYGDAEAMRYIGSSGQPIDARATAAAVARHIAHQEQHGFSLWAIVDRADGSVIGCAGLYLVEGTGPGVEIVYQLVRDRWGHGIATETARACLAHGLGPLGLQSVIGLAYPENEPSVRVMRKIGMREDGEVQAYGRNMVQFSAAADEFPAGRRS
ncbi:MAG: GNAT family N-acetyltransferase [Gaiellales bacterium]